CLGERQCQAGEGSGIGEDRCWVGSFFFSSRRRHTRSDRDWSSDVCSSDLSRLRVAVGPSNRARKRGTTATRSRLWQRPRRRSTRSEERRVGKECRSRWSAEHQKKKDQRVTQRGGQCRQI